MKDCECRYENYRTLLDEDIEGYRHAEWDGRCVTRELTPLNPMLTLFYDTPEDISQGWWR